MDFCTKCANEPNKPEISVVTKTVEVTGIELPYRVVSGYEPAKVLAEGVAFIDVDTLIAVAEQDQWAGAFGNSLVLEVPWAGHALQQAGLAVLETRGGVHGTEKLKKFLKKNGWM